MENSGFHTSSILTIQQKYAMAEQQDNAELVSLLIESQPRMRTYILSLTGDRDLTQEVLQATNLIIWRKADTYRSGSNFIAWAFKIARLQVLSHRRKAASDRTVFSAELIAELAEVSAQDEENFAFAGYQTALTECLDDIPEKRRELLWLRYRDNLKVSEVAERIGKKVGATKQILLRLRVILMRCIETRLTKGGIP